METFIYVKLINPNKITQLIDKEIGKPKKNKIRFQILEYTSN